MKFIPFLILLLLQFSQNLLAQQQEIETISIFDIRANIESINNFTSDLSASTFEVDTVNYRSKIPDSIYIKRLQGIACPFQLPYNSIVRSYIELYTSRVKPKTETILGLSEYYFPIFEEILDSYELPLELKYLAVIESALNPSAVSRAGATGLWQFMYHTGKAYGLGVSSLVDQRRDPIAATHAAARHLKDLYNIYGDWSLVLAAYNCGMGNVNKARRRSNRDDFWSIYYYLPRETRGYVPAFVGAMYAMRYHKEHNLIPPKINFEPFHRYDTIAIKTWVHFEQIASVIKTPVDVLRALNPQYRCDIVPGNEQTYYLKLPLNKVDEFLTLQDSIFSYESKKYNPATLIIPSGYTSKASIKGKKKTYYTVKSGDALYTIAGKFRVRVNDLKEWNNLYSNRIRIGQKLVIYR